MRRELELAAGSLDVTDFSRRAVSALRRAVRFDACCLATVDPATTLVTGAVAEGLDEAQAPALFEIEYARGDVNGYRALSQAAVPVATLQAATSGDLAQSARFREVLAPLGFAHELRVLFTRGGRAWGVGAFFRGRDEAAFDEEELRTIRSLAEVVGDGLRGAVLVDVAGRAAPPGGVGPAVTVVGPTGELEMVTPAARARIEDLPGAEDPRVLPAALTVVVAASRAAGPGGARLRVRGRSGAWWVVAGAPVEATPDPSRAKVVVSIEEARMPDVVPLVVAAFGLSARERDVLVGLLEGRTSGEIAAELAISTHTVNDHLKAIFAKADVRSRRELVARIFFEHYAPRLGSPLGPSGWFSEP